MANRNWAPTPVLMSVETTELLVLECEGCLIVDAIHTVTMYTGIGNVYDPDDGLPLSYEGERSYGDGRLFSPISYTVADNFQGR